MSCVVQICLYECTSHRLLLLIRHADEMLIEIMLVIIVFVIVSEMREGPCENDDFINRRCTIREHADSSMSDTSESTTPEIYPLPGFD